MRAALLLTCVLACCGFYMPLGPSSPHLAQMSGESVHWSTGQIASLMDTSFAIRVSARGLHFYDHDVFPRTPGHACLRVQGALCRLPSGNLVLPTRLTPRYSAYRGGQAPPMRAVAEVGCGTASSGREVVSDPHVYDLSACDLFHGGADVLWRDGVLYLDAGLAVPDWAYGLTALWVLFLVISLGQNIAQMLGDTTTETRPWITEGVCLAQCALILSLHHPWRVWVAEHDRTLLLVMTAYMLLYLVWHAYSLLRAGHVYTLNIITATLILVTSRLYCSFETPYATIFLILLMTRLWHKLHMGDELPPVERVIVACDAVVVALYYRIAYRPGFWDIQAASVYAGGLTCACLAAGALTSAIEKRARQAVQPQDVRVSVGGASLHDHR